jgi:hypothetical protein
MHLARWIVAISTLAIPLNPAFAPQQAAAQQTAAPAMSSGCTGNVNIVRISEVKPGMMDKFLGAVAAQQAWYKNAGTPDEISVMRVMEQNPDTKAWALSDTQAITTHVMPARTQSLPHDAAWDAFVALFKDSSTIKTQYIGCVVSK